MGISFEGIGEMVITFEAEENGSAAVVVGEPVIMSESGKVCACTTEGDVPVGVALSVHGGYAAVQIAGYVKLPCAEGTVVGCTRVSVNAEGKLQSDTEGREAIIVDVDDVNGVCGVIL